MKKYQKAVSSEAAFGVYGVKLCSVRLYFRTAKIKGEELFVMELYLFLALLLIYILTAFMVKKVILHKIWTLAFILAFVVTAVSIAFIRVSGQDVMMSANELNWYYLLYLFGSLSVVWELSMSGCIAGVFGKSCRLPTVMMTMKIPTNSYSVCGLSLMRNLIFLPRMGIV